MDDPMDYLSDYRSDSEDIETSLQDISCSPEILRIYITELSIECSYNGSEEDGVDELAIQIFGAVDQDDVGLLYLDKIAQNRQRWKYDGQIERFTNNDGITIVAQSGQGDILGYMQLTSNNLREVTTQRMQENKIVCILDTEDNTTILKISFRISDSSGIDDMIKLEGQGIASYALRNGIENDRMEARFPLEGHTEMPMWLGNLAGSLVRRFGYTADLIDVSMAISVQQMAIRVTPEGHSKMPMLLGNLATAFFSRFKHTGDLTDISEAISMNQKAISLIPEGHPNIPMLLGNLASSFSGRFGCTGDLRDIAEAISLQQNAIKLTPKEYLDMPMLLGNLGSAFVMRFDHTGDVTDILEAISVHRQAIKLTPEGHSSMFMRLGGLGNALSKCFNCTGDLTDISEAISVNQQAIGLTPEGHSKMPMWLANLATAFSCQFCHTGDLTDISEAISMLQRAIRLTPDGHSHMPSHLGNLASALSCRFDHTGDLTDISEAISVQQKGIKITPKGHSNMPMWLGTLANAFSKRFFHMGDVADISEAISVHQQAIRLTPEGHSRMPMWLGNLASAFSYRFDHTRDLTDISEAISMFQQAIKLTPEGNSHMPSYLANLANAFSSRFNHTGDLTDILEAISRYQQAIGLTPEGHADMFMRLGNLAQAFSYRFHHTGDLTDIAEAISMCQKAISLTPEGHSDMPIQLDNLASALSSSFHHTKDLTDISEAISVQQKAISLTPEGHSGMPMRLAKLASAYSSKFLLTGDYFLLQQAVSHWSQSALSSPGRSFVRFNSALKWATVSEQLHQSDDTLEAYNVAIQLLSDVVAMEKTIHRQYADLADISGVPQQAAAYACSVGSLDKAIEWLEQGRCFVWTQLNNLRSPLDELCDYDLNLANELKRTSQQLEMAASRADHILSNTMEQQMSQQQEAYNHLQLARKRDQLLMQIRNIPQFKHFLQPQPCSELLTHLPHSGPVVFINVHASRCDALALINGLNVPLHIPLPKISLDHAEVLYECLQICIGNNRGDNTGFTDERKFSKHIPGTKPGILYILHELWDCVVKPILDGLAYSCPLPQLSRIWWCATGPLALLPIHAAGIYSKSSTSTMQSACTLSKFVVSSYIPTLRTLTTRIKNRYQIQNKKTGLLMISQPDTPGQLPIPETTTEIRAIEKHLKPHNIQVLCLEGSNATVEQVIINMDSYSCVHFACHAAQHPNNPLESAFFLHDGQLKLSAIIKKNLPQAEIAFLSACQTSVGNKELQDEAVHLAAGMLASGYQGVVATMWSIKDQYAPQVAEDFYVQLMKEAEREGCKHLDSRNAAFAIHYATQKLQESIEDYEKSLLVWVPYVHFGL